MMDDMNMDAHLPTALLRPFVKTYLVIACQQERINRLLPDTSLAIAFRYKGQVSDVMANSRNGLPTTVISGLRKSARLVNYANDTGNIIVIFQEAGAAVFFKEPLHELFENTVSLDHFIPQHQLSIIEEQLAEAQDNTQRIAVVEQVLLSRLYGARPDELVFASLRKIRAAQGDIKIKELADTLCISFDAFEKRFRKTVGTSPKQFSSIVRMKSIINHRQQNQKLTDMALAAGYFDQAHFNKEFKLFTGQTPTDFFKAPIYW